jgi:hypothetical protein
VSTLTLLDEAVRAGEAEVQVEVLVAGRNAALLADQALRWRPAMTVIADETAHDELARRLAGSGLATSAGTPAVLEASARPADWVMAAIVGAAGLAPTLAAAGTGAVIALANKECLVCAGGPFMRTATRVGVRLLPMDSEHNAIFQALGGADPATIEQMILTASGGPFRTWTAQAIAAATPRADMSRSFVGRRGAPQGRSRTKLRPRPAGAEQRKRPGRTSGPFARRRARQPRRRVQTLLRRRYATRPNSPVASSAMLAGSGTVPVWVRRKAPVYVVE